MVKKKYQVLLNGEPITHTADGQKYDYFSSKQEAENVKKRFEKHGEIKIVVKEESNFNDYIIHSFMEGIEDFIADSKKIDLSKHFFHYDKTTKTFSADLSDFHLGNAPKIIELFNPKTENTVKFKLLKVNREPDTRYERGEISHYDYISDNPKFKNLKLQLFND